MSTRPCIDVCVACGNNINDLKAEDREIPIKRKRRRSALPENVTHARLYIVEVPRGEEGEHPVRLQEGLL